MKKMVDAVKRKDILLWILLGAAVCSAALRMQNIAAPLANDLYHSFRTSETAIVIQNFFREGFSLFHSSMPVFGAPWTVMFEMPTYQAMVYMVMQIFHATNIDLFGRIVSVIIFYLSAYFVVKMTKYITNKEISYVVGILYLLSIFNIYWSRAILIDYTSVLFSVIYIYYLYVWLRNDKEKPYAYFISLLFGVAGYTTKTTSMFVVVYFVAFMIIEHEIDKIKQSRKDRSIDAIKDYLANNIKRIILLLVIAIVPVLFGYAWTRYADSMKELSVYTKWLSARHLNTWNYGTIKQKLIPGSWKVILKRYAAFFGGEYVFLASVLSYLFVTKRRYMKYIIYSSAAQILTIFTLFNLFFVHNYYLITLTPFVYLSWGIMLYEIIVDLNISIEVKRFVIIALSTVLLYAQEKTNEDYVSGICDIPMVNRNVGTFIKEITEDDELILITDEDWSPNTLYNAERKGFMCRDTSLLEDDDFIDFIRSDRYTTLETHQIETANMFLSIYPELVQFPIENNGEIFDSESIFVYKFGAGYTEERDLMRESALTERETYTINGVATDVIKLNYKVADNVIVDAVITDADGETHNCKITLLKDTDHIWVDFEGVSDAITAIQIDKDVDITLNY